ncbi:MAG: hypothetical protein ACOY3K_07195 [Candidatus Omnitrophota bacterium]
MSYFRFLSACLALSAFLPMACVFRKARTDDEAHLERYLPVKRPVWLSVAGAAVFALTLAAWYRFFSRPDFLPLVLCCYVTLLFTKTVFAVLRYEFLRQIARGLFLGDRTAARILALCYTAVGILFLIITFLL